MQAGTILTYRLCSRAGQVGAGGVTTDLVKDRSARLLPLTDRDAPDMIGSLRMAPLLAGFRAAHLVERRDEGLSRIALDVDPLIADRRQAVRGSQPPRRPTREVGPKVLTDGLKVMGTATPGGTRVHNGTLRPRLERSATMADRWKGAPPWLTA